MLLKCTWTINQDRPFVQELNMYAYQHISKVEIIQSLCSDHNRIKLEIKNKK